MIASQATDPNRDISENRIDYSKLYERIFPVIVRLAIDVEPVTKQLFENLVKQLIHHLTSKAKANSKDTNALLDAITEAVGHATDGSS
jgi:DNA-dependent protein kinase catalytic subunit